VRNAARALPFRLSLLRTDRCTVRIVFSSRSKTRKLPELNDPWNSFQRLRYDVPISLSTLDYDLLQSPYFAIDILRILIVPLLEAL
jgi:hypothetical protein